MHHGAGILTVANIEGLGGLKEREHALENRRAFGEQALIDSKSYIARDEYDVPVLKPELFIADHLLSFWCARSCRGMVRGYMILFDLGKHVRRVVGL